MARLLILVVITLILTPLTTCGQDMFTQALRSNAAKNRAAQDAKEARAVQMKIERLEKNLAKQLILRGEYLGQVISVSHGNRFKVKLDKGHPAPLGGKVYEVMLYGIEVPKEIENADSKEELKTLVLGKKCNLLVFQRPYRPYTSKKSKYHFCQCKVNQDDIALKMLSNSMVAISEEHFQDSKQLTDNMRQLAAMLDDYDLRRKFLDWISELERMSARYKEELNKVANATG